MNNILCAKKVVRGSTADLRAEASAMQQVTCHKCFPYFLGYLRLLPF